VALREGRKRITTTPTLRRGGKRGDCRCDLCSKKLGRRRTFFTSDKMRAMAAAGLEPDETIINRLMSQGLSRAAAVKRAVRDVIEPATGHWQLCEACTARARKYARRKE